LAETGALEEYCGDAADFDMGIPATRQWTAPRILTEKRNGTIYAASFAKNHIAFVMTESDLDGMPRTVFRTNAVPSEPAANVAELPSAALQPSIRPNVKIEKLGPEPGFYTAVVLPKSFNSKRLYPTIVDVYGGPQGRQVGPEMWGFLLSQWTADQGFIVVSVDNRGTPDRGRDWERAIYQKVGTVPLEDQIKGLELLEQRIPAIDKNRVGIVGWSFGGYMAALAVLKRPDIFHAAVAGVRSGG
jgi:dipeptidyl-peptidase-4